MFSSDLMSEISSRKDIATNQERMGSKGIGNANKHRKYVKRKAYGIVFELEEGIKLHDIISMEDSTLVARFVSK
jgi:hypothetical protein